VPPIPDFIYFTEKRIDFEVDVILGKKLRI